MCPNIVFLHHLSWKAASSENTSSAVRKTPNLLRIQHSWFASYGVQTLTQQHYRKHGWLMTAKSFWKEKPEEETRIHEVGFAIKKVLAKDLEKLPTGVNECLMALQLKLEGGKCTTVNCAYAPTLLADQINREIFYSTRPLIICSWRSRRITKSFYQTISMSELVVKVLYGLRFYGKKVGQLQCNWPTSSV